MRMRLLLAISLVGIQSFYVFGDEHVVDIRTVVHQLGSGDEAYKDLELLRSNPIEAVKLLVKELKPTSSLEPVWSGEHKRREEDLHIVWCVRALRYLTGLDFVATTSHRFVGEDEELRAHFLDINENGDVSFFGTWMSRDTVHLAPRDAQRRIIRQWKAWAKQDLAKFEFPNEPTDFNSWYF